MLTIIFNGSPRKDGNTADLIKLLISRLNHKAVVIDTYSVNAAPCTDCRQCREKGVCSIDDDMRKYYKEIAEADNIVIASPLYFSELTGVLLSFASRFQMFFASGLKGVKKKRGAVILVGGGSSRTSEKAMATASIILKCINGDVVSSAVYINTDKKNAREDRETVNGIYDMAEILNERES